MNIAHIAVTIQPLKRRCGMARHLRENIETADDYRQPSGRANMADVGAEFIARRYRRRCRMPILSANGGARRRRATIGWSRLLWRHSAEHRFA